MSAARTKTEEDGTASPLRGPEFAQGLERGFQSTRLERLTKRTLVDEDALRRVLTEVRARGWAIANEESEDGVRSVAAPLADRSGIVHSALDASAHASRVSLRQLRQEYLPVVARAARGISTALGANEGRRS